MKNAFVVRSKRGGGGRTEQHNSQKTDRKGNPPGRIFFLFLTSIKYYMFNGKVDRLLAQFCYYIPRILRSLNPEKNRNHTHTDGNARKVHYTSYTKHAMLYEKSGRKNRRILQNCEKSSIMAGIYMQ